MQKYFFLLMFLAIGFSSHAQAIANDEAQIRKTLWNYINGRNNGDAALLQKAFYPAADLRYIKNDSLYIWASEDYINDAKSWKKQEGKSKIVFVDIDGNAAQAKVEIEYPDFKFADYINLLKEKGEWRIAVKTFARIPFKAKKVLFVITSHEKMGNTDRKTGFHLGEVSHVYKPIHDAGYEIDFVSPKGGKTFMYGTDMNDSLNLWFVQNPAAYHKLTHAMKPAEVDPSHYAAIYYVGGHGTMWDLPDHKAISQIAKTIYENKGILAAVCHGPSGLVNLKLSNGEYLVKGRKLTSFTDNEERAAQQEHVVPFLLETTLRERGALFSVAENWQEHVVVDGRLITGQNPASAYQVALEIIKIITGTSQNSHKHTKR